MGRKLIPREIRRMDRVKKVDQILPGLFFGDAISNQALEIRRRLLKMGLKGDIFAKKIDKKLRGPGKPIRNFEPGKSDSVLFHFCLNMELAPLLKRAKKKVMVYHNITPPDYFYPFNLKFKLDLQKGVKELEKYSSFFDSALAFSDFSLEELKQKGYSKVFLAPFFISFDSLKAEPDEKTFNKIDNQNKNLIFVGRIAPHKKQEDIILSFFFYKKYLNPKSCLYLVGSYKGNEHYLFYLQKLIDKLDLEDVFFTGLVSDSELVAYYKSADLFLSMSEHEGFCVPLIEAMLFKIPIIAYEAGAVPETLGKGGVLVNKKDFRVIAELIDIVIEGKQIKEKIRDNQIEILKNYSAKENKEAFMSICKDIFGE